MANATAELQWIQSLLRELKVQQHSPVLLCDNQSAVSIAHKPVLHSRTKHLKLDFHFVRDRVLAKTLKVLHIPGTDQIVDALTKPLPAPQFRLLKNKLKVQPLPTFNLRGE